LITQNVDGLHERARTREHDSLARIDLGSELLAGLRESPKRWRDEAIYVPKMPPRCPHCDGLIRPGVVWFGETLETSVVGRREGREVRCVHHRSARRRSCIPPPDSCGGEGSTAPYGRDQSRSDAGHENGRSGRAGGAETVFPT
jgi:hypothetical protein